MLHPLSVLAAAACASAASAQSFYVDFNDSTAPGFAEPSNTYGAALSVGGSWNAVDHPFSFGQGVPLALTDSSGAASGVTINDNFMGNAFVFNFDEVNTLGDDQAMLDDLIDTSPTLGEYTFSGLPGGSYDVYTYAIATDNALSLTLVDVVGSTTGSQEVGGDFAAGFVLGVTHAMHTVTIAPGDDLVVTVTNGPNSSNAFNSCNGIQIVPEGTGGPVAPTIGTTFCSATPNSTGVPGVLTITGSAVAANNDVTLQLSSVPPGEFGIYVVAPGDQGNATINGGVLCLSGPLGRYSNDIFQVDPNGETSLTIDLTQIPGPNGVSATAPGDSWSFQGWHRDGPTSSNFTSGTSVTFN